MTERYAMLRAIEADPNDDSPRLIFADWLDGHGGPADAAMADLIRTDILGGKDKKPSQSYVSRWRNPRKDVVFEYLRPWRSDQARCYLDEIVRGFPQPVGIGFAQFEVFGEALAEYLPLHDLYLTHPYRLVTNRPCPMLLHVRRLSFGGRLSNRFDEDARIELLELNHHTLKNLRYLHLHRCYLSVERAKRVSLLEFPNLVQFIPWAMSARSAEILRGSPFAKSLKNFEPEKFVVGGSRRGYTQSPRNLDWRDDPLDPRNYPPGAVIEFIGRPPRCLESEVHG